MPFIVITWLCTVGVNAATTEQVKLLMVSRNHFKAEEDGDYECHLSHPDTDAIVDSARDAWTLNNVERSHSYLLPGAQNYVSTGGNTHYRVKVPNNQKNESFGIFSCIASKPGKQKTSVVTTRMRSDALIVPQNGLFTQTASVGDSGVSISMRRRDNLNSAGLRWTVNDYAVSRYDNNEVFSFPNKITINDGGVYECHSYNLMSSHRDTKKSLHGLNILIVRACPTNTWGPPECRYVCDMCYNGGVCDENSGSCVCPSGFKGEDCSIACGGNRFGYDCEKMCNMTHDEPDQCRGLLFCLNHPFGCKCNTGWKGLDCETPCDTFTYGANCLQRCNCSANEHCSRYMGCKVLPNLTSAPTMVMKGNSSITISWLEWDETRDTGDSPVIGYIPYYKEKEKSSWIQGAFVSSESRRFTATNLKVETSYLLSVAAVREGGGEGPKSPSLDVETFCGTPNMKPINLQSVVQGYHQDIVNVSWEVPSSSKINCKTGIEGFTIYVASASGVQSFKVHHPAARWYNIEGLVAGRYYRFEMTLSTTGGESFLSEESDMSTVFLPVLPRLSDAPFFLNVTSQSVTIGWMEWNSLKDIGTPFVVAYKPYFKLSNSSKWINGSMILFHKVYEYTFHGLLQDEFYDFSVAAIRDGFGGEGQKSPLAKIKVPKKDFDESSGNEQRSFPANALAIVVIVASYIWWRKRQNDQPLHSDKETSTADFLGNNEEDAVLTTHSKKDQGTSTEDLSEMYDRYTELKQQTLSKMNEEKQMEEYLSKSATENREKEKKDEDI